MQFAVFAYDYTDSDAINRRQAVREAHLSLGDRLHREGKYLYAAALLDEQEKMIGSVLIVDFQTREDLYLWLSEEPYVTGKVWDKIEVKPCRVGPKFLKSK